MSMGVNECFKVAIRGLAANRLRSCLTMLGVIIGVGAVITMTSIGQGAKKQVTDQIQSLGSNLLIVSPGRMGGFGGGPQARGSAQNLTNEIWESIKDKCPSVGSVTAESQRNAVVKYNGSSTQTQIYGVASGWDKIRNTGVKSGTFFTDQDITNRRKVALVGQTVVTDIFAGASPIGQTIRINGSSYLVRGVLQEKGQQGFQDNDDRVIIPLATFQKKVQYSNTVRSVYIQVRDEKLMDAALQEVTNALSAKLSTEEFSVRNQSEILNMATSSTNSLTFLLAGIASVSCIVGGIGIMNIMLVSVTERTREIGLRKALGARRKDIMMQFVIEAVTLSVIGGIIGLLSGIGGSVLLSRIAGWSVALSPTIMIIAVGFSWAVGLIFGIYPASQASKLRPIEALRYE